MINIQDMDSGIQDTSQKRVFIANNNGKMKRDYSYEFIEKVIEKKDQSYIDPREDVNYMPNSKYNMKQTKMF